MKRLRLDREPDPKVQLPVHASIAALLCWRYAQLVTALPKRWLATCVTWHCAWPLPVLNNVVKRQSSIGVNRMSLG